jgi:hypothetical protein
MLTRHKSYLLKAGVTAVVVGLLTLYIIIYHKGQAQYYRLYYFIPAAIAATLLVFDRIERFRELEGGILGLDLLVGAVSLIRAIYPIPFYSGHALFLTYSLLTAKDRLCLLATVVVLVQVIYLKAVVWDADWTLFGGILLGYLVHIVHKLYLKRSFFLRGNGPSSVVSGLFRWNVHKPGGTPPKDENVRHGID